MGIEVDYTGVWDGKKNSTRETFQAAQLTLSILQDVAVQL